MFDRVRKYLTPGTFIALLALVLAVTGGAFAATGGGGGSSHATLTASAAKAKVKLKTGPRGATGPAGKNGANGAQGPAGPAGATGPKGETGAPGGNGADGTDGSTGPAGETVFVKTLGPNQGGCDAGGAEFSNKTGKASACNGESGGGGGGGTGFPETLPEGKTETGTFGARLEGEAYAEEPNPVGEPGKKVPNEPTEFYHPTPISFTVPLAIKAKAEYVPTSEQGGHNASCPGTAKDPKAKEGFLCIYQGRTEEPAETSELNITAIVPPGSNGSGFESGTTGALLVVHYEGKKPLESNHAELDGSWAVTAE